MELDMLTQLVFILDRVNELEDKRSRYKRAANKWESMWLLNAGFDEDVRQAIRQGREQVTLPTPYNTVNLAQRLMSTKPQIDVPPSNEHDSMSQEYAQTCERWLEAMWQRVNHSQRRNVIGQATLHSLVLGRYAFEVKYVDSKIIKSMPHMTFPIHIRALDPRDVGVHDGDMYPEYAYHRYETSVLNVLQRYPDFSDKSMNPKVRKIFEPKGSGGMDPFDEETTVVVTDYWFVGDNGGYIGNSVLIDDEFAIEPWETDYPNLPFVCGMGDFTAGLGDDFDGLSILHGISGAWEYQCRLVSQMATGLMEYFWPAIMISNEFGEPVDQLDIGPGKITNVPWGTKYEAHRPDVNVPLSNNVYGIVDNLVQQSTFPGVMYGEAPGQLQAGFGVSLLADAAKGRIKNFVESLELGVSMVNSLILAIVEKMGPSEGIPVWGRNQGTRKAYKISLLPEMIEGHYENVVILSPEVPAEEMQRITLGLRLSEGERPAISRHTFRENFLGQNVPNDEQDRVILEEALMSDEMRIWRLRQAIMEHFSEPDDTGRPAWYSMLEGTPLMPPPEGGEQQPQPGPVGAMPPGMPPGGMPVQAPGMGTPMGGGIPPQMAGQMTPDMMGMDLRENPLLFQQLMGNQPPPEEELDMLGGGGLPPY